jgi:hypothetical protein
LQLLFCNLMCDQSAGNLLQFDATYQTAGNLLVDVRSIWSMTSILTLEQSLSMSKLPPCATVWQHLVTHIPLNRPAFCSALLPKCPTACQVMTSRCSYTFFSLSLCGLKVSVTGYLTQNHFQTVLPIYYWEQLAILFDIFQAVPGWPLPAAHQILLVKHGNY